MRDRWLAPIGALVLAALFGGPALAQNCDDETIDAIANDGSVIRMRSGSAFRVEKVEHGKFPKSLPIVRPLIHGTAVLTTDAPG